MKKIFLDANILLEVLLDRQRRDDVLDELDYSNRLFVISPLTVHLCYHFCLGNGVAFDAVSSFLAPFEILPMDNRSVKLAQQLYMQSTEVAGEDFEDCLQAACAETGNCEEIVTIDRSFAKHSGTGLPVKVLQ